MKSVKRKEWKNGLKSTLKPKLSLFNPCPFTTIHITCEVVRLSTVRVRRMPARKMRVDVFDTTGNRYTITFEGHVTRDKALRLLDLVELLGGMPGVSPVDNSAVSNAAKYDRVRMVVEKHFPIIWFCSKDVQSAYEHEFKEPISLSTVSTYLSRMADRGVLTKSGAPNNRRYRILTEITKPLTSPR